RPACRARCPGCSSAPARPRSAAAAPRMNCRIPWLNATGYLVRLLGGGRRDAALRLRPTGGIVPKFLDLLQLDRSELAAGLGEGQHVPPGAEVMQLDVEVGEDLVALRI